MAVFLCADRFSVVCTRNPAGVSGFPKAQFEFLENATHIPEGLAGSFPKLRNLTLKSYYREELTIGESVIEEILALRDLKQLALSRYALDEHQLKRLQDELKRKSIRLYLN